MGAGKSRYCCVPSRSVPICIGRDTQLKRFIGYPNRRHKDTPLCVYSDSDFASRDPLARSVTGVLVVLYGSPFYAVSSRQTCASSSSTESELLALNTSARLAMYMRTLLSTCLKVMGQPRVGAVEIFYDNSSLPSVSKGMLTKRTRHLHVKGCWLYYLAKVLQTVKLTYVNTKENWADTFTKALVRERFRFLRYIILGSASCFSWETFQASKRRAGRATRNTESTTG